MRLWGERNFPDRGSQPLPASRRYLTCAALSPAGEQGAATDVTFPSTPECPLRAPVAGTVEVASLEGLRYGGPLGLEVPLLALRLVGWVLRPITYVGLVAFRSVTMPFRSRHLWIRDPPTTMGGSGTGTHRSTLVNTGHDGGMYIESPFGEFSDYALVRLTVPEATELRDVLNRMLKEGPTASFRAYIPPSTTGTQMELAWELG